MASILSIVPWSRLHFYSLVQHLLRFWDLELEEYETLIPVTSEIRMIFSGGGPLPIWIRLCSELSSSTNSLDWWKQERLGCSSRATQGSREVDFPSGNSFLQLEEIVSCEEGSSTLLSFDSFWGGLYSNRQLSCPVLHKSPRGNGVSGSSFTEDLSVGRAESPGSVCSLSTGKGELACRPPELPLSYISVPLYISQDFPSNNSEILNFLDRSLRHGGEFPAPEFLHTDSISEGLGEGCFFLFLVKKPSVLLSAIPCNPEDPEENLQGPGRGSFGCPTLTTETLVSDSFPVFNPTSLAISTLSPSSEHIHSLSICSETSKPRGSGTWKANTHIWRLFSSGGREYSTIEAPLES